MHHHAALEDQIDIDSVIRFLCGRAIGFVAAGGGSFGTAHVGIYKAFRERGVTPPAVNSPELYAVRSCQAMLPKDQSWQIALDDWHSCRTKEHPTGGFKPMRSVPEGGFGRARRYAQEQ